MKSIRLFFIAQIVLASLMVLLALTALVFDLLAGSMLNGAIALFLAIASYRGLLVPSIYEFLEV